MLTNELKKGDMVYLSNGWKAIIMDNKKGNTRLAEVYGFYTEIGSVYSHDIAAYVKPREEDMAFDLIPIQHTKAQVELREMVGEMFA